MSSKQVRWGILGAASIAEKFVDALSSAENAVAAGIASREAEKAAQFAQEHGVQRAYRSYEELLDDTSISCVYIPVPTTKKREWALKAIAKGKHVLVDKPFASEADVQEMAVAAHRAHVQFMDGTMWVHNPRAASIKKELASLGGAQMVTCHLCTELSDRDNIRFDTSLEPLGALGDLAWYCVRGCLWAMDYTLPATVMAVGKYTSNRVLTAVHGTLAWADGRSATLHSAFELHYTQHMQIMCKDKMIRIDDPFFPWSKEHRMFPNLEDAKAPLDFQIVSPPTEAAGKERVSTRHTDAVYQEVLMVEHFSKLSQEPYRATDWATQSIKTMRVVDALLRSVQNSGAVVAVGETAASRTAAQQNL